MRILIVENGYRDLILSRVKFGEYLESKGHQVFYICPDPIETNYFHIEMSRNKLSFIQLLKSAKKLSQIEKSNSIDIVLTYRFIPNVLNYISSFLNHKIKRTSVITGLGVAFSLKNIKYRVIRFFIKKFYSLSSYKTSIITQNPDDLITLGLTLNGNVVLGSGFLNEKELMLHSRHKKPEEYVTLLYVGRLLKSKGIADVIDIFKKVSEYSMNFKLIIVGDIDEHNPDSIDDCDLSYIKKNPLIEFLGFLENLTEVYLKSDVLLFPSKYREGVPRAIIESLSYGLTIITKDMPGCKECVRSNGLLMDDSNQEILLNYLKKINKGTLLTNSLISRNLFETKFSSKVIYPQYEQIILN
jgi:glycosyltransferase involved in cell wall biosynthesis